MFRVFVGVEGFTLPEQVIVKELSLMFENDEFNHFIFEQPLDFTPRTDELTTIKYTTSYIHGLNFTDGCVPYSKLDEILQRLHNCKIFCCGENTRRLIQRYIPLTPVTNIQHSGYIMPTSLQPATCGRSHFARNCSLAKATAVKNFCMSS